MKKIAILIILLSVNYSFAQRSEWGLKGSLQWTQFFGNDFIAQRSVSSSTTPDIVKTIDNNVSGVAVGAYIRSNEPFFIQGEALFSYKGGQLDRTANNITDSHEIHIGQLDLPFSVGYRYGQVEVLGGPQVSVQLFNDNKLQDFLNEYALNKASFSPYRKVSFGYHIGLGFHYGKVSAHLRNFGTIQNAVNAIITYPASGSLPTQNYFAQRIGGWQIGLSYRLR